MIQIMSAIRAGTYTSVSKNIKGQQLDVMIIIAREIQKSDQCQFQLEHKL